MADLLSTPFAHYRSPACVVALAGLCEVVWQNTANFDDFFPGDMRLNLTAWYDVYSGPRPEFLPAPSQSQWADQVRGP